MNFQKNKIYFTFNEKDKKQNFQNGKNLNQLINNNGK